MVATAINVHVQTPLRLGGDATPSLALENWKWVLFLVFPLDTLEVLPIQHKPYKWIRYCTGAALGITGKLSTASSHFDASFDYDAGLPTAKSQDLYFHTTNAEKSRMFPVDPLMVKKHGLSTSDATRTRRAGFMRDVCERDGNRCIVTGMPREYCQAAHLIGHGKGNAYIQTFTTHRGNNAKDIIDDIDSVRNGVLVSQALHIALGIRFAMLRTPNFAMSTRDADPTASDAGESRVFAHVLHPAHAQILGTRPNGATVRLPDERGQWPPDALFDAVYASAVLENFGQKEDKEDITAVWKARFYPGGAMNALRRDQQRLQENRDGQIEMAQRQNEDCDDQRERRSAAREADDLHEDGDSCSPDYEYIEPPVMRLMPLEQRMAAYEGFVRRATAARKEAAAVALKETADKVRHWQEGVQCAVHEDE